MQIKEHAIQVKDRQDWRVDPATLRTEFLSPGSTNLPAILPQIKEEEPLWGIVPPDKIQNLMDLNNLYMKVLESRRDLARQVFGDSWLSDPLDVKFSNEKIGLHRFNSEGGALYFDFQRHSLIHLNMSFYEFHQKIADTAVKVGVTDNQIVAMAQAKRDGDYEEFMEVGLKICLPIYRELFREGYSTRDLLA